MNISDIHNFSSLIFLLAGIIFNVAFWFFKLKDIEQRLVGQAKRIGVVEARLNRLINKGNRKLGWDFEYYEDTEN